MAWALLPVATVDPLAAVGDLAIWAELRDAYIERFTSVSAETPFTMPASGDTVTSVIATYQSEIQSLVSTSAASSHWLDTTTPIDTTTTFIRKLNTDNPVNGDVHNSLTRAAVFASVNGGGSWTRKWYDAAGVLQTGSGTMQPNDLFGAWIVNEMKAFLDELLYTKCVIDGVNQTVANPNIPVVGFWPGHRIGLARNTIGWSGSGNDLGILDSDADISYSDAAADWDALGGIGPSDEYWAVERGAYCFMRQDSGFSYSVLATPFVGGGGFSAFNIPNHVARSFEPYIWGGTTTTQGPEPDPTPPEFPLEYDDFGFGITQHKMVSLGSTASIGGGGGVSDLQISPIFTNTTPPQCVEYPEQSDEPGGPVTVYRGFCWWLAGVIRWDYSYVA